MNDRQIQVGISLKANLHDLSRLHLPAGVRQPLIKSWIGVSRRLPLRFVLRASLSQIVVDKLAIRQVKRDCAVDCLQ